MNYLKVDSIKIITIIYRILDQTIKQNKDYVE
jgi:hypothetical protein